MGKNDYAKRLQARKQLESEITQRWTAQLCLDVITIVLNDPEVKLVAAAAGGVRDDLPDM